MSKRVSFDLSTSKKLKHEIATMARDESADEEEEELYKGCEEPIRVHDRTVKEDDLEDIFPPLHASSVVIVCTPVSARLVAYGNGWLAYYME